MIRFSRLLSLSVLVLVLAVPAFAYNVVNTSAPSVNCIFSTTCTLYVSDMSSPILGSGKIQSRIVQGQPGSAAAGKWLYLYRIDLRQVAGITSIPYVTQMAISGWGPVRQYDYNFDSVATDHVFNITAGGLGTKAVTSSTVFFGWTYFILNNPVYGGNFPGDGESSYFFGLVSDYPPSVKNASVDTDSGWVTVQVFAPTVP
jgi:hypothetical protein